MAAGFLFSAGVGGITAGQQRFPIFDRGPIPHVTGVFYGHTWNKGGGGGMGIRGPRRGTWILMPGPPTYVLCARGIGTVTWGMGSCQGLDAEHPRNPPDVLHHLFEIRRLFKLHGEKAGQPVGGGFLKPAFDKVALMFPDCPFNF